MSERESQKSLSLRSFKLTDNDHNQDSPQSLESIIIEKEEPRFVRSYNQFDEFYQQLSLSFYTPKLGCYDKKMPKSLLDLKCNYDKSKCNTESQKFLFPQPTLSNGVSESTVESQNQFNYHSTSNETVIKGSSNKKSNQEEITFYTPDIEDKILVFKDTSKQIENKIQASTSFYQGALKKSPKLNHSKKPVSRSKQKVNLKKQIQKIMVNENNYFLQKQYYEKEKKEQQIFDQVVNRINISALKHILEQDKKQANISKNSFYFTRKANTKESSESQNTSNGSQQSCKSGLLYQRPKNKIINLLQNSPYLNKEVNKKSNKKKIATESSNQSSYQNIQQQYLQKQLEEIKKYQAKDAIKQNQSKADYGLKQINLDQYIKNLIKKQK